MLISISEVVGQFKQQWARALSDETLAQACRAEGMRWHQTRLNPIITLKLFLLQILHGNTAMTNLRHLSKPCFTASAYCQARGKIPLAVCQHRPNSLPRCPRRSRYGNCATGLHAPAFAPGRSH